MRHRVRVLLFATARQAAGRGELEYEVPPEGISVGALLARLTDDHPGLGRIVPHARLLRNGEYLRGGAGTLRPGDEFAVHPPYSGG